MSATTEVPLPLKEFDLLEYLMRNAGRVLTRGQLIDRVWGSDYVGDTKTLDVHVKRLRAQDRAGPGCAAVPADRPRTRLQARGLTVPFGHDPASVLAGRERPGYARSVPEIPVVLSTASAFPEPAAAAFSLAADLGYDGVEVMVMTEAASRSADTLRQLIDLHQMPVRSVHSPCLLITARVWSTDPLVKLARSIELAEDVGASTVVVHPPFVWQRAAAATFVDSVAELQTRTDVRIAVENMFPVKVAGALVNSYRPHWDPLSAGYGWYTLDLSHTAASGSDALLMAAADGGAARPPASGRRLGRPPRRAPGARTGRPAVRSGAGAAGPLRLHRHGGRGDQHQGPQPGHPRGGHGRGADLRPAAPGRAGGGAHGPTGAIE